MSKELEALKLLEIEYDKLDYTIEIDNVDIITLLRKALAELEAIKSADGGRVMRSYYMLEQQTNGKHLIVETLNGEDDKTQRHLDILKNYILKAQAQEQELRELKEKIRNFINEHVAYPYDEDGIAYDDDYTKDYEELLNLCKGSEE